jgi:predicted secreted protein
MGWNSGSEIAQDIWNMVAKYIPEYKKKELAIKFINYFEAQDCDVMDETDLWDIAGLERDWKR